MYYNSASSTPVAKNPFRYRGYYYDLDLGLYYLNSRYYDQRTSRFISPDDASIITATPNALTDKNLYAYCDNNPVMRVDNGGEFWNVVAGAVVGATINLITSVISEVIEGNFEWKDVGQIAISTGIGAIEGAMIALAPGAAVAISAVSGSVETALIGIIDKENLKTIAINSILSGAISAAGAAGSIDFARGGKLLNDAASSFGNVIRKGVHPVVKKSSERIVKKAVRYIGKSALSQLAQDFSYGSIYEFGSWYINASIERALGR